MQVSTVTMSAPAATPAARTALVKDLAAGLGFDLVGVARVEASAYGDAYVSWVGAGKHGAMGYLARNVEERLDLRRKFAWARSVVCVGLSYYQEMPAEKGEAMGKVARYAWGRDYHRLVGNRLDKLEAALRGAIPEAFEARTYTDTGPVLERELAARAGLGWVGKNTLLLHPEHGSYFVLGELVTSLELEPDSPVGTHCGTCTRCVEACPTAAITPFSVDATRCISYWTLEDRGAIPGDITAAMGDAGYLVGCDICQDVCPFNRRPLATREADFAARPPAPAIPLREVLAWDEQQWDIATRGRAHRRARFAMWRRNAETLLGLPAEPAEDSTARESGGPAGRANA